jgi:hypothetical protein
VSSVLLIMFLEALLLFLEGLVSSSLSSSSLPSPPAPAACCNIINYHKQLNALALCTRAAFCLRVYCVSSNFERCYCNMTLCRPSSSACMQFHSTGSRSYRCSTKSCTVNCSHLWRNCTSSSTAQQVLLSTLSAAVKTDSTL